MKDIYSYGPAEDENFPYGEKELQGRVTVRIVLSSVQKVDAIKRSLQENLRNLQDFECEEEGFVLTVSGTPYYDDLDPTNTVLNIVKKLDPNAAALPEQ